MVVVVVQPNTVPGDSDGKQDNKAATREDANLEHD